MDLKHIKGIGDKTIDYLYKMNIYSVEDLLNFFPYRYQIIQPTILENTTPEETITINAIVASVPRISFIRKNFNSLKMNCETYGKIINVTIFNRAFLKPHLIIGKEITLIGKYKTNTNSFTANDILLTKINEAKIIPIYHTIKGIKIQTLNKLIANSLKKIMEIKENLPPYLCTKYHLISKRNALENIHIPKTKEELKEARKRLIYEELFEFMFKIEYLKSLKEKEIGIAKNFDKNKIEEFIETLPFKLTEDQKKGIDEGLKDLKKSKRMNRLLLGDVGAGKTIVAITLMYGNYLAGFQSAFMAPTEILALQHYESIRQIFANTNIEIEILIGSMTKKEKENILKKVLKGDVDILIGTHAVLNEKLFFANLGFIVTDEQHRFGVNQRETLKNKGSSPDMLFMSATPIPRTYALTIYGDMDTTIIKEKPNGRKEIITKVVKEKDLKEVLLKVLEEIKKNHQIYVVAPTIDENDSDLKNVNLLQEKFNIAYHNKIPIGTLHGKMKKNEKDEIMQEFKTGKTKILISTTVIEVGVDVKEATIMIIFNAERFGLATLHQLRGRVGRNNVQSYCYLICNEEKERLKVLEESNNGFYISEKDFEFRGEGDLFGQRQSGDMTFKLANIKRDYNILIKAKEDAREYIQTKEYEKNQYFEKIIKKIDFTN